MASNLYETLGISKSASPDEIRKAYKKRALQTHPDRQRPGISAEEKAKFEEQFREVNHAYEVLSNPQNRSEYDRIGVWPPPTTTNNYEPRQQQNNGEFDPFMPRGGYPRPFVFTDPFVLFEQMMRDLDDHFNDPIFSSPFATAGMGMSPFDNMHGGFGFGPSAFGPQGLGGGFQSQSISYSGFGNGGRGMQQSESITTTVVNGRTETVKTRVDPDGTSHVTYITPEGERHLIHGVEQTSSGSSKRIKAGPSRSTSQRSANKDAPYPSTSVPQPPKHEHPRIYAPRDQSHAPTPPPPYEKARSSYDPSRRSNGRQASAQQPQQYEAPRTSYEPPRNPYSTNSQAPYQTRPEAAYAAPCPSYDQMPPVIPRFSPVEQISRHDSRGSSHHNHHRSGSDYDRGRTREDRERERSPYYHKRDSREDTYPPQTQPMNSNPRDTMYPPGHDSRERVSEDRRHSQYDPRNWFHRSSNGRYEPTSRPHPDSGNIGHDDHHMHDTSGSGWFGKLAKTVKDAVSGHHHDEAN
ncbi:hypothetical protein ABKN59_004660 [Abortiporus biennis]